MGRFNYTKKKAPASATQPEWLALSAGVGTLVNAWSGRYDLAAFAGHGAAEQHPAFFDPELGEVEVDVTLCFGKDVTPDEIGDITKRPVQFEWPRAVGAIFHEALHARFSRWDLKAAQHDLTNAEFLAMVLLEESRIESHGVKLFPKNAPFLRSMVVDLVANNPEEIASASDTVFAANAAALTLARVDAGSVDDDDVAAIREVIALKLSDDVLAELRKLWLRAQAHEAHHDPRELYTIAREWVRIVDAAAAENGDPGSSADPSSTSESSFAEAMADAIADAGGSAAIGAFNDLSDAEQLEAWEAEAAAKASSAKDRAADEKVASEVFGRGTTEVHGTASHSSLMEKRQPTGAERAAAVSIARLLEKAKYRDRDETEISSVVPPGRLRTRAAVQSAALKSKGIMSQAEPWRRTVRKHTEDPTLSVGVMVDISGSMADAMQGMGVAAWVMSEATRRVQGRAAMVYYGNDVFPTLKPGQHLSAVNVYSAPDSTEKFGKGFSAINGALGLTWGTGARLLVVVSDGCYTPQETAEAKAALQLCERNGVGVLWLDLTGGGVGWGSTAPSICNGTSAVLVQITSNPVDAAAAIGQAAARALEAAA